MKVLLIVGLALAAAGFVVGVVPTSVTGEGPLAGSVSCGSAFAPSDEADSADFASTLSGGEEPQNYAAKCDQRRSLMITLALVLLIPGLAMAIGGGIGVQTANASSGQQPSAEE